MDFILPLKNELSFLSGIILVALWVLEAAYLKQGMTGPKYYNSHDHTFFNKGTMLFGLDRAKKAIAQAEAAFLVEGYTDLIVMNQHGFTNTVATLGTACTQEHLKNVARYAQKLLILYDGDAAGQNAIIDLQNSAGMPHLDPYVITLPSQDDPASFLLGGGDLGKSKSMHQDIFSFILTHMGADFDAKKSAREACHYQKNHEIIIALPDPLKRDLLLTQASHAFCTPSRRLKKQLKITKDKN